jgi:hypothetical protein
MKIKHVMVAATTALLLTTGNAWAGNDRVIKAEVKQIKQATKHKIKQIKHANKSCTHKAPEIDAASGTSAIALLTGALLLAGERIRSRHA